MNPVKVIIIDVSMLYRATGTAKPADLESAQWGHREVTIINRIKGGVR